MSGGRTVVLASFLALAVASTLQVAQAQDGCRPIELVDLQQEMADEADAELQATDFTGPPPGIAIVFDPEGWSGQDGSPPPPGELLRRAIQELETPRNRPEHCHVHPFAETAFLRHPGLFPAISDRYRRLFVAAEIARTTSVVFDILERLADDPEAPALVRYRALLEMLNRGIRAPGNLPSEAFETLLARARAALVPAAASLPNADVRLDADVHLLAGLLCLDQGGGAQECLPNVDRALEADPWFSAARQLRIELLDQVLRRFSGAADGPQCEAIQSQIVVDISNLLNGLEAPRNMVDLGLSLDAAAGPGNLVLLLGAAHAMAQGGAQRLADAAFDEVEVALATPHACNAILREALNEFQ